MNPYPYLAALALIACMAVYAVWERGQAEHWHQQYSSLQASYNAAAIKIQQDALAQEAKAKIDIQKQADSAVAQAYRAEQESESAKSVYLAKLASLKKSNPTDLPHLCSNIPLPSDLRP